MKKLPYYTLTTLFILLGMSFAIILTYNHFYISDSISLFCPENSSYFDCKKISQGKYSSLFGIPISIFGIAFYISVIFYYLMPTLNEKQENFLKIPFLLILILANIIDLILLSLSLIVINTFCMQCSMIYIANLGILILFYLKEFRSKNIADEIINYSNSIKKDFRYQKELTIFFTISILFFFLLYFFSNNKQLYLKLEQQPKISENNHNHNHNHLSLEQVYKRKTKFKSNFKLPYIGNKNAPIDIIVFHDLQCSHCQNSFFTIEKELEKYKPLIKISYINLPFNKSGKYSQLNSFQLALYSWYAFSKGKYHEFLTSLFTKFKKNIYIDKDEINKSFKEIGINQNFNTIEEKSRSFHNEIKAQANAARQFFIKIKSKSIGTPSIFINERSLGIGYNKELIDKVIQQEIINFAKIQYEKITTQTK